MNTNDDIELHDLQTIEARLRMEPPTDAQPREGEGRVTSEMIIGAASAFMIP